MELPNGVGGEATCALRHDSSRPRGSLKGWLIGALDVLIASLFVLCAIDLASDFGWGDFGRGYAKRTELQQRWRLGAVVVSLLWLARRARRWRVSLRGLPIPRVAALVLVPVLVIEVAHVFIQSEKFPFSNVGMFQYAVPPKAQRYGSAKGWYVVRQEGGPTESVSLFREGGGILFRRYGGLDGRTAWVLRAKGGHPTTRRMVSELVEADGERQLRRISNIKIDLTTGEIVQPKALELR